MDRWVFGVVLTLVACLPSWGEETLQAQKVAQVHERMRALAKQHPAASLVRYGESAGGAELLALRIAGPGPVAAGDRPAVFLGGNACGDRPLSAEAALHFATRLLKEPRRQGLVRDLCVYVTPVINPDAHDASLGGWARQGNAQALDRDRDGLVAEDGPDDLDGDGSIRSTRIPDASGEWTTDPRDPRLMVRADPTLGERGRFRLEIEGRDDDADGRFNEDGPQGLYVDRGFAHGFPYPAPEAGPWPSAAPEGKALMDFLLARPHVALAIVLGKANTLLALPAAGPKPKRGMPAKTWDDEDRALLARLSARYKARLKRASLPTDRSPSGQTAGSLGAWLHYHYGAITLELDQWGPPLEPAKSPAKLTLKTLATLNAEAITKRVGELEPLFEAIGAPRAWTADTITTELALGLTPQRLAERCAPYAAHAKTAAGKERARRRAELAYWTSARAAAVTTWTRTALRGHPLAESGGLDPLAVSSPPRAEGERALATQTAFLLDTLLQIGRLEIRSAQATALGGGVFRLEVVVGNSGKMPTHSAMATLAKVRRPVRLELELPSGGTLITGRRWASKERLSGTTDVLRQTWLLIGSPGATLRLRATSQHAGNAERSLTLEAK